jgi:hypothetical protein
MDGAAQTTGDFFWRPQGGQSDLTVPSGSAALFDAASGSGQAPRRKPPKGAQPRIFHIGGVSLLLPRDDSTLARDWL